MWWTALLLGVIGSLHCAGMCSPLLAAVAIHRPFTSTKFVYNSARIVSYGIMGAAAASVGSVVGLFRYQQSLSLGLGLLICVVGLSQWRLHMPFLQKPFQLFSRFLKKMVSRFLQKGGLASVFSLGLVNGFLPCGLTYLALSYCFILPSYVGGFLFMFFFGLGTWPVMFGFSKVIQWLVNKIGKRVSHVTAVTLLLSGILLIGRTFFTHQHEPNSVADKRVVSECK